MPDVAISCLRWGLPRRFAPRNDRFFWGDCHGPIKIGEALSVGATIGRPRADVGIRPYDFFLLGSF